MRRRREGGKYFRVSDLSKDFTRASQCLILFGETEAQDPRIGFIPIKNGYGNSCDLVQACEINSHLFIRFLRNMAIGKELEIRPFAGQWFEGGTLYLFEEKVALVLVEVGNPVQFVARAKVVGQRMLNGRINAKGDVLMSLSYFCSKARRRYYVADFPARCVKRLAKGKAGTTSRAKPGESQYTLVLMVVVHESIIHLVTQHNKVVVFCDALQFLHV